MMKRGHKKTSKIQKRENGFKYFKSSAFPAYTAIAGTNEKRNKKRHQTRKHKTSGKLGKRYVDLRRYMNISNVAIA